MVFHQIRVHVFGASTLVFSNTAKNTHFTDPLLDEEPPAHHLARQRS